MIRGIYKSILVFCLLASTFIVRGFGGEDPLCESLLTKQLHNNYADLLNECTGELGDNVMTDSDFGSGVETILPTNPGIVMDQGYVASLYPGNGNSCIANSTASIGGGPADFWISTGDSSGDPNGYMLVVDSWFNNQVVFTTSVDGLCENSLYQFDVDVINLINPIQTWATHAHVEFFINGAFHYTSGSTPRDGQWHTYSFFYATGPGETSLDIIVENGVPGGQYGDFAMDNIELRRCIPQTELQISGNNFLCEGDDLVLEADLSITGYATPAFQWQQLTSGAAGVNSWVNIFGENDPELNLGAIETAEAGTYRCIVSGSSLNLLNSTCWGDSATINIVVFESPDDTSLGARICQGDSYYFNGDELYEAGIYSDTLSTMNGCDSIITLQLEVVPNPETDIHASICAEDFFLFHGTNYYDSGTYDDVLISQYGCDSTVTLYLTVKEPIETILEPTICFGTSYQTGSFTFDTAGDYVEVLEAEDGCDSTVYISLEILPENETYLTERICFGTSYTVGTSTYNASGNYTDVLSSYLNCDSTVYLNLTVDDEITTNMTGQICSDEVYTVGTTDYNTSGVHTTVLTSYQNCDSIVILDLDVIAPISTDLTESVCAGGDFTIGTETFSETGQHQVTLTSYQNCDSLITLNLTVDDPIVTNLDISICNEDVYPFDGNDLSTSGNYQLVTPAANGCDSTVNLVLEVREAITTDLFEKICDGDVYTLGTTDYTSNGTYTEVFDSYQNCDSTVILHLKINPIDEIYRDEEICDGDSIVIGNQTFNTNGQFSINLQNQHNCDSTIYLDLRIKEHSFTQIDTTICEGESVNGYSPTQDSTIVEILPNYQGCDSTVTTNIIINPNAVTYIPISICEGESYNGETYLSDTTLTMQLMTVEGCDSLVFTTITVNEVYNSLDTIIITEGTIYDNNPIQDDTLITETTITYQGCDSTINTQIIVLHPVDTTLYIPLCDGESYEGQLYESDTMLVDNLTASNGADSTVYTNIEIFDIYNHTDEVSICEGGSHFVGGALQTDAGFYTDTYTSINGCDSIIVTELIVNSEITTYELIHLCEGESSQVHGNTQDETGIYTQTFQSSAGCDSISTIEIIIHPEYDETIEIELCEGETYEGTPYTENTILQFDEQSYFGCDSLTTVEITVLPATDTIIYVDLEFGESYDDITYTQDTTLNESYISYNGCDSTITTIIDVQSEFETLLNVEICTGESYDGITYTDDTVLIDTFTSVYQSDSVVITTISILPTFDTTLYVSLLIGETYNGFAYTQDTTLYDDYIASNGCDSLVTTIIEVDSEFETILDIDLCIGEEYEGVAYTENTSWSDTLTSIYQSDSIVITNINMLPTFDTTLYVTLQLGDSYEGIFYTMDTTLVANEIASNGCDSLVTTIITVDSEFFTELNIDLCEGESHNGIVYDEDATLVDTLVSIYQSDSIVTTNITVYYPSTIQLEEYVCESEEVGITEELLMNQYGCDSLVITNLILAESTEETLEVQICQGDTYEGIAYSEDTVLENSFQNEAGCDSTVNTIINVMPLPVVDLDGFSSPFCFGEFIEIEVGGLETTIWTDDQTIIENNVIEEGGVYYVQVANEFGCSAIDTLDIPDPSEIGADISAVPPPCYGEPTAYIVIDTVYGGEGPYVYGVNGNPMQQSPVFDGLSGGVYNINIQDANGCEFSQSLLIEDQVAEFTIELGDDLTIELGDSIQLDPNISDPNNIDEVIWTPADELSCDTCINPIASPTETTIYNITIITDNGCSDTDEIIVRVENERRVYIPNAFTPDGNGTNDVFLVYTGKGVEHIQQMIIFDRWGNHLFERFDFDPDDPTLGWDGYYRGERMNSGVFVYYIEVLFEDGTVGQYKGDVTLLN